MKIFSDNTVKMWEQRTPREQFLLLLGLVALLIGGIYSGVINPIMQQYADAQDQYETAFEDYRWLQEQGVVLNRLYAQTGRLVVTQPIEVIEKKATNELNRIKLRNTVKRVKKDSKEWVQIEVQEASAVKLMRWLDAFTKEGVVVYQLNLENRKNFLTGTLILGN